MKPKYLFILFTILCLAAFLRFYQLDSIPAGLHGDGASQGYNAYSLIKTGVDRYGERFPFLFRSLGSYQPPIYTYLTILSVSIFGNSIFAARFISALSGVLLILATGYLLHLIYPKKNKILLIIITSLSLAIAPWSIFFSRLTVEANLGLTLFVISLTLLFKSLKQRVLFPASCLLLGLTTHAYYSERIIVPFVLIFFLVIYRKELLSRDKKKLIIGGTIFLITLFPHLYLLSTGAFAKRFDQTSYLSSQSGILDLVKLFLNNYLSYFSPKNLFFDSGSALGRIMPNLSTFYSYLLIPFFLGLKTLIENRSINFSKLVLFLMSVSVLPAAFTGDSFYPLRTLVFLWSVTLIISLGITKIYQWVKLPKTKLLGFSLIFLYSLISLYISYFVLFKYETAQNYGFSYIQLLKELPKYPEKEITIDSGRDPGVGIRIAYLNKVDPKIIQDQLRPQMETPYYSSFVNNNEVIKIENVEAKKIDWSQDCNMKALLIGDQVAISDSEVILHELKPEFEIRDLTGKVALRGFTPLPKDKCSQPRL